MIPYIINVALILAGCLVFYKLLLRKETFHRINRVTLMLCLFLAFSLPLVQVPEEWSLREVQKVEEKPKVTATPDVQLIVEGNKVKRASRTVETPLLGIHPVTVEPTPDIVLHSGSTFTFAKFMNWLWWLYWFGVILFALTFVFQLCLLLWKVYRHPVIRDGRYRIVEIDDDKAPCSFAHFIFINPAKYDAQTYQQILLHEKVHVQERHSLDIIFAELMLIFQWFNPFAWIYRREVENNLEFLTDNRVTQNEQVDKKAYQLSLVRVSAPNIPLRLTTNYNQSILKKRIAMMNSKRSNLHTAWKYFFLIPVLALLACLLNEPRAQRNEKEMREKVSASHTENEGYWFARIEGDVIYISFDDEEIKSDKQDGYKRNFSGTNFKLSELSNVPRDNSGTFSITREAGKMEFTGKFEGNIGMGKYKFLPDAAYFSYIKAETKDGDEDEEEQIAFFLLNVKKSHVSMLKNEGFKDIRSEDLISTTALGVDAAFVKEMKTAGLKDLDIENLVALKAMSITPGYVKEIRDAGYTKVDAEQLIGLKAQGIDREYIEKMKKAKGLQNKDLDEEDLDDIISYKAMDISDEFVKSFRDLGIKELEDDDFVSLKAMGVTPEYIKMWQDLGFKDLDADDFVAMKSQDVSPEFMKKMKDLGFDNIDVDDMVSFKALGITPEYYKSFGDAGIKDIELDDLAGLKAMGITPEYLKSFEAAGYKTLSIDDAMGAKAMGITPEYLKSFESAGFKNISIEDALGAKAMNVTPEYIKSMRAKGLNYDKLEKYIRLKSID